MITEHQFSLLVEKLQGTYGKATYGEARTDLLFELIKNHDLSNLDKYLNNIILNSKAAPLGAEFQEFIRRENFKKNMKNNFEQKTELNCEQCADAGLFALNVRPGGQPNGYVCNCDAGVNGNWSKLIPRHEPSNNLLEFLPNGAQDSGLPQGSFTK